MKRDFISQPALLLSGFRCVALLYCLSFIQQYAKAYLMAATISDYLLKKTQTNHRKLSIYYFPVDLRFAHK